MKRFVVVIRLMLLLLVPCVLQAQEVFDPGNFCIDVHTMLPAQYGPRVLNAGYTLDVQGNKVNLYLPYMGRVYRPSYDNEGLDFVAPITDYKVKTTRKGGTRVTFRTRRNTVTYDISIDITSSGRVAIMLKPDNAQWVSYEGDLRSDE